MNFVMAMMVCSPGMMRCTVQTILGSKEVIHPLFEEAARIPLQAEYGSCYELGWDRREVEKGELFFEVRSRNVIEEEH